MLKSGERLRAATLVRDWLRRPPMPIVVTFAASATPSTFIVPPNVYWVDLDVSAPQGAGNGAGEGLGGRVRCRVPVVPGETLTLNVGPQSIQAGAGGAGGSGVTANGLTAGGGGTWSKVVGSISGELVIAGGGGGHGGSAGGGTAGGKGGHGGGLTGGTGAAGTSGSAGTGGQPGTGGSASADGTGGAAGTNAVAGTAPNSGVSSGGGGSGGTGTANPSRGGGGGGGGGLGAGSHVGAGGGGGGNNGASAASGGGGGGGAASSTAASAIGVIHTQGSRTGDGVVTITYTPRPSPCGGLTGAVIQDWAGSTSGASNVSSLTQNWGATPKAGNLLLCATATAFFATNPPTGFILLGDFSWNGGLYLYGKVAEAGEVSVVATQDGSLPMCMAICEMEGFGLTTELLPALIDVFAESNNGAASDTNAQATGTTATTSQDLIHALALWAGDQSGDKSAGVWGAAGSGFTRKVNLGTSGGSFNYTLAVASKAVTAAGTLSSSATPTASLNHWAGIIGLIVNPNAPQRLALDTGVRSGV